MTIRLSHSSLTGTERTLVAVGTVRLTSMLAAVRAGAPRRVVSRGSSEASALAADSGSLGTGAAVACGFGGLGASALGWTSVAGEVLVGVAFAGAGAAGACCAAGW